MVTRLFVLWIFVPGQPGPWQGLFHKFHLVLTFIASRIGSKAVEIHAVAELGVYLVSWYNLVFSSQ